MQESRPGRRVAIVAGVRTPFQKSGTAFRDVTAVALARHAARELLYRSEVDGREVDEVIFSQVVPSVLVPNIAREVSLLPQFLPSVPAYTLNRACASSAQAIANAADQIALGHADTILAGGVETLSDIPILHSRRFSRVLVDASRSLLARERPDESLVGIVLAAGSLVVMPLLARAKRRVAARLTSSALTAEARQTEICT